MSTKNAKNMVAARESMKRTMEGVIETSRAACDKFAAEFSRDPGYAFTWCGEAMLAAARIKVYSQALHVLGRAESFEAFAKFVSERLICAASQGVMRSTSATANAMTDCELTAWADVQTLTNNRIETAKEWSTS